MMEAISSADVSALGSERAVRLARLNDELLARYAARGNDRAFAVLYGRYHQPLYGYCRSIVRNDADAQDALQSTFALALSALKRQRRNAPLRPWLFRIAHNEAISILRRRRRDGELARAEGGWPAEGGLLVTPSAEDQAAERARWASLTADLAELPERLRGALLLRELSGLSHEEIATALGTTVGGAKQAIFEARQALVELAEGRAMTCEDVQHRISDRDGRALRGRRIRAHLRDCVTCAAFAAVIPARQAELRGFAPVLPPVAAAAVLSHAIYAGSGPAAATSASAASTAATATAVGKTAGTVVVWKTLATGGAVLVTAAAGVSGLAHVLHRHQSDPPVTARSGSVGRAGSVRQRGRAAGSPRINGNPGWIPGRLRVGGVRSGRLPGGADPRRYTTPVRAGKATQGTPASSTAGTSAGSASAPHHAGAAVSPVRGRSGSSPSGARGPSGTRAGAAPRGHGTAGAFKTRSRGKAGRSGATRRVQPPRGQIPPGLKIRGR